MAHVELAGISKAYGAVEVIRDLDLAIEDGSFTVFVGPSGCGKSTLLRMIAGLEPITGGEVRINARRVNEAEPIERGVAMVFQNYALYPHMTVEQNIGFSLRMAGLSKSAISQHVAEAARSLQIEPLLKRRPAELSGGQRQRVAIGRAIVRQPEVFLFDEPLSNLDAELRVSMRVEIARLHQRLGSTMIYVTHDQTEAMTLADKIVVMRAGRIEQAGSPDDLYEDPANSFVAGFIGSPRMNFIPAQLRAGRLEVAGSPFTAALPGADGPIQLGIRPEHFTVGEGAAGFSLTVDVVENLGGTRFLYGTLADGTTLVVEARDRPGLKAGDVVPIGFAPERAYYFDADGARIRKAH
ncbi:MAG: sn-glycerol-3-phosphate ABC transporter ATP-binding protein UgpC [Alphaproteobacteria bacterium]|jgi:lactose/L-arabinose transport system ATP-binding protein|nr:sn-glycerol-3-phosphate ABC transporter ATP-binding protein UgpC [Alphaproteobacteria bacterium]MBU1560243.1 sn-glycerol-3-phosphate ABC transporter ATP-binding protein UgpC [Alphaproteobacteria bacterium]MBU2303568.1 sn-glycerol-3-phosphate ABC transporter ATP-binding protein UgpC [Alphaproteobacteria bacterium]